MSKNSILQISILKEDSEIYPIKKTQDELIEELIVKHNSLVEIVEEYILEDKE